MADSIEPGDEEREQRIEEALKELGPALWTWVVLRVGPRVRATFEPDDVFQETWLRAFENAATLDPARPVRPWLFGIARNVLREALRRHGRESLRRHAGSETSIGRMDRFADTVTSVTRRLAREENFRAFIDRLAVLSDDDRRLLLLHGLEGGTLIDAALQLEITPESAKKRWQRLRAQLTELGAPGHLVDEA